MKFLLLITLGFAAYVMSEDNTILPIDFLFTTKLYKEMAKDIVEDFVVSPLSVKLVLATVLVGAKGNTSIEISRATALPRLHNELQMFKDVFHKLKPTLSKTGVYNLSSANIIYVGKNLKIYKTYQKTALDLFDVAVKNMDFSKTKQAAKKINAWVENKTHNLIKKLVNKNELSSDVSLFLVNALYFQGNWKNRFTGITYRIFHSYGGFHHDEIKVKMMTTHGRFKYAENSYFQVKYLEMPYLGDDITMTIILPFDYIGLARLEHDLQEVLSGTIEYTVKDVNVMLPLFKMETSIKLKSILKTLGVVQAFEDSADFSRIGDSNFVISDVVQKAYIDVNLNGTTAAAATSVTMTGSSAPPKNSIDFIADHGFVYYISTKNETYLFIGRYNSPAKHDPDDDDN